MSAAWTRLLPGYDGPLVEVELSHPDEPRRVMRAVALLDTGATTSLVDLRRVAGPLALPHTDTAVMATASGAPSAHAVFEIGLQLLAFDLGRRRLRAGATILPPPFAALLGMDLIDGTRLALEWRGGERWLRWELLR